MRFYMNWSNIILDGIGELEDPVEVVYQYLVAQG